MYRDVKTYPLLRYLAEINDIFYGDILSLRKIIEQWLGRIPQAFPHYTCHSIRHSEEIIYQLSCILFRNDDPMPVVSLSATEVFILCLAAYLHDVGMVISEKDKLDIIRSDDWEEWITVGSGTARWGLIKELRINDSLDESFRNYLADIQTRYLLAEYFRKSHHLKSKQLILDYHNYFGNFSKYDHLLIKTVADICCAHGYDMMTLNDNSSFPYSRDIEREKVDVKFIAVLLRIGDLLDMSSDRACPMLLNAACPLPSDSYAHWSSYERIKHKSTSCDEICLEAECLIHDEHRLITDWCNWLVSELHNASYILRYSDRHSDWRPPRASIGGDRPTLDIAPAREAKYIPLDWKFKFDSESILNRLIYDIHSDPFNFILELLQNSLDTTRCKILLDISDKEQHDMPYTIDESVRSKYPITIKIYDFPYFNDIAEQNEIVQIVEIEDNGMGMDERIIENYFLQIGRSYYNTKEFRDKYRFIPTSRFGIGFMSVFKVSNNIEINTMKYNEEDNKPIKLMLNGPRNYILIEKGDIEKAGTSIIIKLREKLFKKGDLIKFLREKCKMVEFPIKIEDSGEVFVISPYRSEANSITYKKRNSQCEEFRINIYPVELKGIRGVAKVFAKVDENGESWTWYSVNANNYIAMNPHAELPHLSSGYICFNGIKTHDQTCERGYTICIDIRSMNPRLALSKEAIDYERMYLDVWGIYKAIFRKMLNEHMEISSHSKSEDNWKYKQSLMGIYEYDPELWDKVEGAFKIYKRGKIEYVSYNELMREKTITVLLAKRRMGGRIWFEMDKEEEEKSIPEIEPIEACIVDVDYKYIDYNYREKMLKGRIIERVAGYGNKHVIVEWVKSEDEMKIKEREGIPFEVAELETEIVGIPYLYSRRKDYDGVIMNCNSDYVKWMVEIIKASKEGKYKITREKYNYLVEVIVGQIKEQSERFDELERLIKEWDKIENVPRKIKPPRNREFKKLMIVDKTIIRSW